MNRILVLINISLLLISCSRKSDSSANLIFRYNCENNITSLDPAFASTQDNIWAVVQLYNGLVSFDSNLNISPDLANRWEVSKDGKIYTFHLQKNVLFHDDACFSGVQDRIVTAHDFVYSFNRILDPATASPGAWIFNERVSEGAFQAIDDTTLVIELIEPFSPFLGILSMPYCKVVPKKGIEFYGKNFSNHPIGTGPFQYANWEADVALHLDRNPNYHESQMGNLDGVQISFVQNKQMALLLFLEGELDLYNGINGAIKDFILDKNGLLKEEHQHKINLQSAPVLNTEYLAMMVDETSAKYPWNNLHFRRAVSLCINRESMMKNLRNNVGIPGNGGFIPKGLPGHTSDFGSFDKQKAQVELAMSGYLNNPVSITLHTTRDYTDLCIFVQKSLEAIGVSCQINVLPSAQLKEEKRNGNLSFFRASWIMDYPDAENYLSCFYTLNFAPSGPNYTHFSNSTFDQLYNSTLQESNDSIRLIQYHKMDSILMSSTPIAVLYYDESLRLTQKRVKHLPSNPLNIPILKQVTIEQ